MGASSAVISRNMYDEAKRYVETILQAGVPLVDADYNDQMDSTYQQLRRLIANAVGDGVRGAAFQIVQHPTLPVNDIFVSGGEDAYEGPEELFLKGYQAQLGASESYLAGVETSPVAASVSANQLVDTSANYTPGELVGKKLIPNIKYPTQQYLISANTATTITVEPPATNLALVSVVGDHYRTTLTTPAGERVDLVYLDVFLDEIGPEEDPDLYHTIDSIKIEAMLRKKLIQRVFVKEGVTLPFVLPKGFVDADGIQHVLYPLAQINRLGGIPNITNDMIIDLRVRIYRLSDVEDRFVNIWGDTMIGTLVMDADIEMVEGKKVQGFCVIDGEALCEEVVVQKHFDRSAHLLGDNDVIPTKEQVQNPSDPDHFKVHDNRYYTKGEVDDSLGTNLLINGNFYECFDGWENAAPQPIIGAPEADIVQNVIVSCGICNPCGTTCGCRSLITYVQPGSRACYVGPVRQVIDCLPCGGEFMLLENLCVSQGDDAIIPYVILDLYSSCQFQGSIKVPLFIPTEEKPGIVKEDGFVRLRRKIELAGCIDRVIATLSFEIAPRGNRCEVGPQGLEWAVCGVQFRRISGIEQVGEPLLGCKTSSVPVIEEVFKDGKVQFTPGAGQVSTLVEVLEETCEKPEPKPLPYGTVGIYRDTFSKKNLIGEAHPFIGDLSAVDNYSYGIGPDTAGANLTVGPFLTGDNGRRARMFLYDGLDGLYLFMTFGSITTQLSLVTEVVDVKVEENASAPTIVVRDDPGEPAVEHGPGDWTFTNSHGGHSDGWVIGPLDRSNPQWKILVHFKTLDVMKDINFGDGPVTEGGLAGTPGVVLGMCSCNGGLGDSMDTSTFIITAVPPSDEQDPTHPIDFPGVEIRTPEACVVNEIPLSVTPVKTCECIEDCAKNPYYGGHPTEIVIDKPLDECVLPVVALHREKTKKIAYWGQDPEVLMDAEIVMVPAKYRLDENVGENGSHGVMIDGCQIPGEMAELARLTQAQYGFAAFKEPPFSGCRNIWMDLVYLDERPCAGVEPVKREYMFFDSECGCGVRESTQEISDLVTDRHLSRILPDDGFDTLPTGYPEAINFEYCSLPDVDRVIEEENELFLVRRRTPSCAKPNQGFFVRIEIIAKNLPLTVGIDNELPVGYTLMSGTLSGSTSFTQIGGCYTFEYVVKTPLTAPPAVIRTKITALEDPSKSIEITDAEHPVVLDEECLGIKFFGFGSQNANVFGKVYWSGGGRFDPVIPPEAGLWAKATAGSGSAGGKSAREQYLSQSTTVNMGASTHVFNVGAAGTQGFAVGLPVWIFNNCLPDNPVRKIHLLDIEEEEIKIDPNEEVVGLYGTITDLDTLTNEVTVQFDMPPAMNVRFLTTARASMMVAPTQSKGFYWEASPALVELCGGIIPDMIPGELTGIGCIIRWGYRFWNSTKNPAPGTLGAGYICNGDDETRKYELHGTMVKDILNPVDWINLFQSPAIPVQIIETVVPGSSAVDACDICLFEPCDIIQIVDNECTGREGGGKGFVGSVRDTIPGDPAESCEDFRAVKGSILITPKIPAALPGCDLFDGFRPEKWARIFVKPDIARYAYGITKQMDLFGNPLHGPNYVVVDFATGRFVFDPTVDVTNPEICFLGINNRVQLPEVPGIYYLVGLDKTGCKSPPTKAIRIPEPPPVPGGPLDLTDMDIVEGCAISSSPLCVLPGQTPSTPQRFNITFASRSKMRTVVRDATVDARTLNAETAITVSDTGLFSIQPVFATDSEDKRYVQFTIDPVAVLGSVSKLFWKWNNIPFFMEVVVGVPSESIGRSGPGAILIWNRGRLTLTEPASASVVAEEFGLEYSESTGMNIITGLGTHSIKASTIVHESVITVTDTNSILVAAPVFGTSAAGNRTVSFQIKPTAVSGQSATMDWTWNGRAFRVEVTVA